MSIAVWQAGKCKWDSYSEYMIIDHDSEQYYGTEIQQ